MRKAKFKQVIASLAKKNFINFKTKNIKCSDVTLNDNNFTIGSLSFFLDGALCP